MGGGVSPKHATTAGGFFLNGITTKKKVRAMTSVHRHVGACGSGIKGVGKWGRGLENEGEKGEGGREGDQNKERYFDELSIC